MLNIRIISQGQGCAIAPLRSTPYYLGDYPRPSVLPLEPDDAPHFERDPRLDYIIREWRLSDDLDTTGFANASDMHALTIVFRSGRREPCFYPIPMRGHRGGRPPLGRARAWAEAMLRDGDEGVSALNRPSRGLVTALGGLVGLPAKEARFRLAIIATVH